MWLAANSTFKSDSDLAKYEKARRLKVRPPGPRSLTRCSAPCRRGMEGGICNSAADMDPSPAVALTWQLWGHGREEAPRQSREAVS